MIADLPPVSPFRRHWDGDTRPVVDVDIQGIEHESQPGPPVDDYERLMTVSNATVASDPSAS
jgi:hypothetical protein